MTLIVPSFLALVNQCPPLNDDCHLKSPPSAVVFVEALLSGDLSLPFAFEIGLLLSPTAALAVGFYFVPGCYLPVVAFECAAVSSRCTMQILSLLLGDHRAPQPMAYLSHCNSDIQWHFGVEGGWAQSEQDEIFNVLSQVQAFQWCQ